MNQPSLDFEFDSGFCRSGRRLKGLSAACLRSQASRARVGPTDEAKRPAHERRVGIKEETALANAPTKPNPSPKDAIAAQNKTRNLPINLAHGAPRVPATRRRLLLSRFLRLPTTLPFALALARVALRLLLLPRARLRHRR
jgi:hypothetical protein